MVGPAFWQPGFPGALGLWSRGLRCGSVLAEVMGIKGAFGVACGDRTSSTLDTHHLGQGRTQLRGSALTYELHPVVPPARVVPALTCEPLAVVPVQMAAIRRYRLNNLLRSAGEQPATGVRGPLAVCWALSGEQRAIGWRDAPGVPLGGVRGPPGGSVGPGSGLVG